MGYEALLLIVVTSMVRTGWCGVGLTTMKLIELLNSQEFETMPPCPGRSGGRKGGTSFGTSSSSRGDTAKHDECERLVRLYKECKIDRSSNCDFYLGRRPDGCPDFNKDWFETAVISFFKLFGEKYDYELLTKRDECERLVRLYKKCETNKLSDCDYHLERRPEGCTDFSKGTSFGTSSSRRDYDWFETAVISFFKLFGENYDYELLTKREECERLVGLYKVCKTNKLSHCDVYLEQRPEGCPDFNKGEY
ncbi:hypothetical protein HYC85_017651 [Camellia sinensis]|uniref:Uncharacterized protein n=1 Tax=Camellia sinensis TaxID=4442 RepID=A0A7J7GVU5_CAMSI|nr:hypothetical protein HYC85_017651 [Camellia sinensis]